MDIVSVSDCSELAAYKDDWARLSEGELHHIMDLGRLQRDLAANGGKFRLFAIRENSQIKALACFTYHDTVKHYEIATHKLFSLPAREVRLYGSCVLGQADEDTIRRIFRLVIEESAFDVLHVGEILIDSPLHRVLTSLKGLVAWRVMRKQELRWLVRLPEAFDDYTSMLRPTVRTRVLRDARKFERERPEYRVMHRPEDIDAFLRDAGEVSRVTYQWHLGYQISDDKSLREHLTWLASHGIFRGYVAYLGGKPCAFGWGELNSRIFIFRSTGYDPVHRNLSPGTSIILHIIRDLIDNADCDVFDFCAGSEDGYKSRLATISIPCARMAAAPIYRPYAMLLAAVDVAMNLTKNSVMKTVEAIAGHRVLKRRLKAVLRPLGVGSY